MVQCNYVDNVRRGDSSEPLHDEVITNSILMADMAASPHFDYRYISPIEMSIGSGYTIKLEDEKKNLYKDGVKVEPAVAAQNVITEISQARTGGHPTSRIGATISENYGLHMSTTHSFQFYKRITYPSDDDEETAESSVANGTQVEKRYGYRCTNKSISAPKTCGNKVKSGNPINSAHNCPGKGYECTFPQGPNGDDYGICCYSISTAQSCGFEGGYCFLDKVKNTCGTDCLN